MWKEMGTLKKVIWRVQLMLPRRERICLSLVKKGMIIVNNRVDTEEHSTHRSRVNLKLQNSPLKSHLNNPICTMYL
ncbi:hypothetical protein VIGAN_04162900 [Vigna angularis var. angularis]|uniref:Uncharacterized protein n=1 Tax=Vigna angularis var. angularis TaxID=157739 RepID=A0A0S3RUY3_PHAAN|nr:hypothetical protein VIGAN_04162900 [Vigna angularis var. angularis]